MARGTAASAKPRGFALQTRSGESVTAGGVTLTPQSRVLMLHLPVATFVWQRPVAVVVERDGRTTRLPIRDLIRLAQIALGGGVVLVLVLAGRMFRPGRKERER